MTMPARLNSSRICSRNFFGMACDFEISEIFCEDCGGTLHSATSARSAYFAFCEIIETRSVRRRYSAIRRQGEGPLQSSAGTTSGLNALPGLEDGAAGRCREGAGSGPHLALGG